VLFLFFFLGCLFHWVFKPPNIKLDYPIFKPMILLSLVIFFSGVVTLLRHLDFFPFFPGHFHELVVNVNNVSSGGAIMSCVFTFLNYITGFLFFVVVINTVKSREFIRKIIIVLASSASISLIFALVQKYYSLKLGNSPFFINMNRLNSTFSDSNSFGLFVSAFIPVLLGMFFVFKRSFKIFSLVLIGISLFIFPLIGSRSGLLGLFAGIILFVSLVLVDYKKAIRSKLKYVGLFFLIVILTVSVVLIISGGTELYKRLRSDVDLITGENTVGKVMSGRTLLWGFAVEMIRDYPVTGVGLGSFIIEFPNYMKQMNLRIGLNDSAENYFLQAGSELGLLGLLLALWIFSEIIKAVRINLRKLGKIGGERFMLFGLVSGIAAVFVNFLLHSYIGAFDVKYFFWLLVGLVLVFFRGEKEPEEKNVFSHKYKFWAFSIVLIFATVHLWNSTHSLSISQTAERFGWEQSFGLYEMEKDEHGFYFKWAKKSAGLSVSNLRQELVVPIKASHPGIERHAVRVKIYLADQKFRKKDLLKELVFRDNQWHRFEYPLQNLSDNRIYLLFETDRDWQPLKLLGMPDTRRLAVCLGIPWFRISSEDFGNNLKMVQKISAENWRGEQKNKLYTNGIARMKFNADKQIQGLRLHVKGQKLFDVGSMIVIRMDDQLIGKTVLEKEGWGELDFSLMLPPGEHELRVDFVNGFCDINLRQDRNVFLGDIDIFYK